MLTRVAAQAMVDGLSAVALVAWSPALASRRRSPFQVRLGFAFGALGAFYVARMLSAFAAYRWLELPSLLAACVPPLAALLLAEGVLRRHAPVALKLLVTAGGAALATAILLDGGRRPVSSWGLGGFLILSLGGVAAFLLMRPRGGLSRQEGFHADALLAAGGVLALLGVSDFLPWAPLGLSGVGTAMLAFVLAADPAEGPGRPWRTLAVMLLFSAAGAAILARVLGLEGDAAVVRLVGVLLALLLAVGAAVDFTRPSSSVSSLPAALARADSSSLDRFLADLSEQPLVGDLRVTEGVALADYAIGPLVAAVGSRPVWTRSSVQAALAGAREPLGLEQLDDLLVRTESSHALLLSDTPVRIGLLALSGTVAPATEAYLALFAKLAASAAHHPS